MTRNERDLANRGASEVDFGGARRAFRNAEVVTGAALGVVSSPLGAGARWCGIERRDEDRTGGWQKHEFSGIVGTPKIERPCAAWSSASTTCKDPPSPTAASMPVELVGNRIGQLA